MSFLLNPKIGYLKIDVSCEASINFHHMSQKATHATRFAPCHTWRSADNAIRKTRDTTRLKCLACHAKCLPKSCASHETCKSSSENDATVARLLHSTTCDAFMKHDKMPRGAMPAIRNDVARRLKPPNVTTFTALARGTAIATSSRRVADGWGRLWTVADGCGWLRMWKRRPANTSQPPDPQSKKRTVRSALGFGKAAFSGSLDSILNWSQERETNPEFVPNTIESIVMHRPRLLPGARACCTKWLSLSKDPDEICEGLLLRVTGKPESWSFSE